MRRLISVGLGCVLVAGGSLGCSERDVSLLHGALAPAPAAETGQLELALTAQGASGALYRLRQAQFDVFSIGPGFSPGAFLSTEDDPLATTLEATLDIGDYVITLLPGWVLEKVQGGEVTRVQARLLSSESQDFSIAAHQETSVRYRFETDGQVLDFGQGRLIVAIDVEEREAPPDPVFTLGEPLEIVDGVISPDSNPFGISAGALVITAQQGTEMVLTRDTGALCVRGSTAPVRDSDFATQWGGLWGLEFRSEEPAAPDAGPPAVIAAPWDLAGGRVVGFAFTVSGPQLPPLRLQVLPGGADPNLVNFCTALAPVSGEPLAVPFSALDRNCWEGIDDPLRPDSIASVFWLVPADTVMTHVFDVCISDVRPLLR